VAFCRSPFFYGETVAFFDYDPHTGLRTDLEYDELTGKATIITSDPNIAAAKKFVDRNQAFANASVTDSGIKKGYWHYASIPPIVQVELRNKGLDMYSKDPSMMKRVYQEINQNYAYCKVTQKHHE